MYVHATASLGPGPQGALSLPTGADRRMARIQRLACERAIAAMNSANLGTVDGIHCATALGCLEDTAAFLDEITAQDGRLLAPLPFMRSTHNTMAGQIALALHCTGPNMTFSQGTGGFHAALLSAWLQVEEDPGRNVLVFAADEHIDILDAITGSLSPALTLQQGALVEAFVMGGAKRSGSIACIEEVMIMASDAGNEWSAWFGREGKDHPPVLWAADAFTGASPVLPAERHAEQLRVDPLSGTRSAQLLELVLGRFASKEQETPVLLLERTDEQQTAILLRPC